MDPSNDQPTTASGEKFGRTIPSNPMEEEQKPWDRELFLTRRVTAHSEWKNKKKLRSEETPCSSFLHLVQAFLRMVAIDVILAGGPVVVASSFNTDMTERVTLQAGKRAEIPFDISYDVSNGYAHYTLGFGSIPHPFCINGDNKIEGFKSQSQSVRFNTIVAKSPEDISIKVNINPVDIIDEDTYILRIYYSESLMIETIRNEVLVQIPPGTSKCFITTGENSDYPYEVHCEATTGSEDTILTCYQYGQRVEMKNDVTDNDMVTRAVFLLPDSSPFSCCSHDVISEVNITMCNDFEWPPRNNHMTHPTVYDPSPAPPDASTYDPIGNAVQSHVNSGNSEQYSSVLLIIVLTMFLLF